ncbi:MAG: monofunctional biosynthetic peptidoglycan transglycosylase [Prevotella sp.]|nr:monofunctional biosynthetic peptidoglycan transglycosylase [Candidatus Prevotella equi]
MKLFRIVIRTIIIAFFASTLLAVVVLKVVPVYFTPLMFIRAAQSIGDGHMPKMHHRWVPMEKINVNMPTAVMASEDQRFLVHHGFDFDAIQKAAKHNRTAKTKHGASTISQQTAKNVFLWPGRSWVRKGLEMYFTVLIECIWGKERIMEVYLNSIEMGDGIYGVDAVAEDHFEKTAQTLSKRNCALIAATLPNPRRFSSKEPSSYMLKRQRFIVGQMKWVKWEGKAYRDE